MTPKEKAEELVDKYINASFNCKDCNMPFCDIKCTQLSLNEAKQCALIAVDEMLNDCDPSSPFEIERINFWENVKNEIEKL